jgi:hypothetical protein
MSPGLSRATVWIVCVIGRTPLARTAYCVFRCFGYTQDKVS